jgi:hypothetical protein
MLLREPHSAASGSRVSRCGFASVVLALGFLSVTAAAEAGTPEPVSALAHLFAQHVERRLNVPQSEQEYYGEALTDALSRAGVRLQAPQYVLLVDRSPVVQAAFIYWMDERGATHFVGATPASTGKPGAYEYFVTPLGVFPHTLDNMDYRAEGTRNEHGIRGYGVEGMRVYDFGWVEAERGWGAGGRSLMRLQVHATDPDLLERFLGTARSKGCIRIPAKLNAFIDRYGLLDADYEEVVRLGGRLWVLRSDRQPAQWPGRYLVIVDSQRRSRPAWASR